MPGLEPVVDPLYRDLVLVVSLV